MRAWEHSGQCVSSSWNDFCCFTLQVNGGATNTELLEGRIIKLGVVCNGAINRWLLLKYVGDIKCKFES